MPGYLDAIVAHHRAMAATRAAGIDLGKLALLAGEAPAPRPFRAALVAPGTSIIAEAKRRSPSKGELAPGLDAAAIARAYASGGAACLSVITDGEHFGGSISDLVEARAACDLPALRKDFTVCEADVLEAWIAVLDAVLLIVAALSPSELAVFRSLADSLGMAALVEVHDAAELGIALDAGADLIGVNQRDLRTFEVDERRAEDLSASMPDGIVRVAESGITTRADVERLEGAGFHAMLVGERLVTAPDPASAVRSLRGAGKGDG